MSPSLPRMPPVKAAAALAIGAAIAASFSVTGAEAAASASGGGAAANAKAKAKLPPNHPDAVMSKFGGHLKCPYAKEWMSKGPEAAARELGIIPDDSSSHRNLADEETAVGSCSYTTQWTGPSCLEFRGSAAWDAAAMEARCSQSGTEGVLSSAGEACPEPDGFAGYCKVGSSSAADGTGTVGAPYEYGVLALGGMAPGCSDVENACVTFMKGEFVPDGACAATDDGGDWGGSGSGATTTPSRCAIAPGPIGGAHQDGYSSGYDFACPGDDVPGASSPWQWPLRWAANFEGGSIKYQTDEVIYQNGGRVFYRLDKNWKRHDFYYQRGYQRSIVQGPCEQMVDKDGEMRCIRTTDNQSLVLHRGNKMVFIELAEGARGKADGTVDLADITECSYLDMMMIGNIRPDWFMDSRGDLVDTQYLGNQHIYYPTGALDSGAPTAPMLAKQWRKRDFANHYFTMSMQANPGSDGVHWPLVLNVPGEGFGDDSIQHYYNHSLLPEDNDDIFLIDEAYVAAGGSCPQVARGGGDADGEGGGGGGGGPPQMDEPFPSDLEIDENSWFSNEYTFSPTWMPPLKNDEEEKEEVKCTEAKTDDSSDSGMATMDVGDDTVVESCFDAATGEVELAVHFNGVDDDDSTDLNWLALAFRRDSECLMTPRSGDDGEVILIRGSDEDASVPAASHGPLAPAARRGEGFDALGSLPPLDDAVEGFSNVAVVREDGAVKLRFRRAAAGGGAASSMVSQQDQPVISKVVEQQGSDGGAVPSASSGMVPPPEVMHLTYAYGLTPALGYHTARECFAVTEFPACPSSADDTTTSPSSSDTAGDDAVKGAGDKTDEGKQDTATTAGTTRSEASGKCLTVLTTLVVLAATVATGLLL